MMEKTDEYKLRRIMLKAEKHGIYEKLNDYTSLFDDLSEPIKAYLKSNINEEVSGIPIIFFTKPSKEWTLLCTRSLIGYAGDNVFSVSFQDLVEIQMYPWQIKRKNKGEWDELTIVDKQSNEYIFHTLDGYTHFLLHNVLLLCCHLAKLK